MNFTSIDPATEKILTTYTEHTWDEITRMLQESQIAFQHWRITDISDRQQLIYNLRKVLLENEHPLASLITLEMGKPFQESVSEIRKCADCCTYYAERVSEMLHPKIVTTGFSESKIIYQPIGTVLAIMPWNFPFWQVLRCAIPTLLAGNTVLLKHAPNVGQCANELYKLFLLAGFPKSVFQNVRSSVANIEAIIAHPTIQGVSLTGSTKAGSSVASIAGKNIKKTVLELGGNDAFIVLRDADIVAAAKIASTARTRNAGQSCIAPKRFIIEKEVYEVFKQQLIKNLLQLRIGNPFDPATTMGPVAREDLRETLQNQVNELLSSGAKIAFQTKELPDKGWFFPATVLENIDPANQQQELFGPVFCLYSVLGTEEAVNIANATQYGLGCSLFTSDYKNGILLSEKLLAGSVFINESVRSDPHLPFGGIKQSGYGRELGEYGITEFVNIKTHVIK